MKTSNATTNADHAIGVFDSGVGGLTVAGRLIQAMPNEKIIYFGDTARVPYGSKSEEVITRFSFQIADFLCARQVKAIVVACNTVSATCLPQLQARCPVPVFGVIAPGVDAVLDLPGIARVGVIGTERTVNSNLYATLLSARQPQIQVFSKACPLFVPLAEEGLTRGDIAKAAAAHYLTELTDAHIDALILGCTHYPLLAEVVGEFCGDGVQIVDPALKLAALLKEYLSEQQLQNTGGQAPRHEFYVTDSTSKFAQIARATLGQPCEPEIVVLGAGE